MPENKRCEATTLLSSKLYTEASEKVAEETEKEINVPDPSPEDAEQALAEAEISEQKE
jgi:hypothetical protein